MPGERKYPMPDKAHAINAKARATQMEKKGKISESTKEKIDAKANRILGEKSSSKKQSTKSMMDHSEIKREPKQTKKKK